MARTRVVLARDLDISAMLPIVISMFWQCCQLWEDDVERGFGEAMPSSSLQALYGWRSVQRDCKRWLPDMQLVLKALKGLNAQYKKKWGQDALVPERSEPFPLWARPSRRWWN